ncbi:phosphoesterase family-domain-containing protein [Echria macrotheca]|uniref:Phosphoesterase family-domain-containing protein n=1 Tax=Echria macrotheca TaxID=438768 RepID=A0AAJ0BML3_9PEZI|nr:phosphoesterase family-domain-containing protein [Echria macrotheca]
MKIAVIAGLTAVLTVSVIAYTGFSHPPYATTWTPIPTVSPDLPSILAKQAEVKPSSPTSNVSGFAFDRIFQIWLENVDFEDVAANKDMQWLASQGILLTNLLAVTHPSQPNYAAAVAGDYFGLDHDDFVSFPPNISTVVDLLDTKNISWGEYMEDLPYPGFQGHNFLNQQTGEDDYVRKHNPLMLFDSVALNQTRRERIKGFDAFWKDLRDRKLPQWGFITPNMTNDGHDTNLTFAAAWTRRFLEPLLVDEYFMERTLLVVTFDENWTYQVPNRAYTILLSPTLPSHLRNTSDPTPYTHYSLLSTTQANWNLPSLGRWDCHANILSYMLPFLPRPVVNNLDPFPEEGSYYNISYPGPVSIGKFTKGWWAAPITDEKEECIHGRGVWEGVREMWKGSEEKTYYGAKVPADGMVGMTREEREGMWEWAVAELE